MTGWCDQLTHETNEGKPEWLLRSWQLFENEGRHILDHLQCTPYMRANLMTFMAGQPLTNIVPLTRALESICV